MKFAVNRETRIPQQCASLKQKNVANKLEPSKHEKNLWSFILCIQTETILMDDGMTWSVFATTCFDAMYVYLKISIDFCKRICILHN